MKLKYVLIGIFAISLASNSLAMDSIVEQLKKKPAKDNQDKERLRLIYTSFPGLENITNQYLIDAGEQLKKIGLENGRSINTIPVSLVQKGTSLYSGGNNIRVIIIAPSNNNPPNSGPPRGNPRIIPPQLPFFTNLGAQICTILEQHPQAIVGVRRYGKNKVAIISPVCKWCYDTAYTVHNRALNI